MKYRGLSLFANVGIAESYLNEIGYPVVLANELLPERAKFYNELHCHDIICGNITNENVFKNIIEKSKKLKVNFILATPPCQGMSIAGRMEENDIRNLLITKAMDAFIELQPEFMLIENVERMFKTYILIDGNKVLIKDYVESIVNKYNYMVKFDIFNAADYGTAQNRKRSFIRIYKKDYEWLEPKKESLISVYEKIGDLPSLESGEKSNIKYHNALTHNKNHILWMKHTPSGKTALNNEKFYPEKDGRKIKAYLTTYKRISWDKPSPTITMSNASISSQNNVHPGHLLSDGTYSDARALTLLEIIRLTGLPDDWKIPLWAKESLVRKVIGEAIPPILVKKIFLCIKKTCNI